MLDRLKTIKRSSPHSLRWRVRGYQLRVLCFEALKLSDQSIIARVRDRRVVQHVIPVVVLFDLGPKRFNSL